MNRTYELLAANSDVELKAFEIGNGHRRVVCLAPKCVDYMERLLGSSVDDVQGNGLSYKLDLVFQDGSSYRVPAYLSSGEPAIHLGMPNAIEPGWTTHRLGIASPSERGIPEMIDFLALPFELIGPNGMTMYLFEDNATIYWAYHQGVTNDWTVEELREELRQKHEIIVVDELDLL